MWWSRGCISPPGSLLCECPHISLQWHRVRPFPALPGSVRAQKLSVLGRLHHQPSLGRAESPRAPGQTWLNLSESLIVPQRHSKQGRTWGTQTPLGTENLMELQGERRDRTAVPTQHPTAVCSLPGLKGFLQPKFLGERGTVPTQPLSQPSAATWPAQTLLDEDEGGVWGSWGSAHSSCCASGGGDSQGDSAALHSTATGLAQPRHTDRRGQSTDPGISINTNLFSFQSRDATKQ